MSKILGQLVLLVLTLSQGFSQTFSVKGVVMNSTTKETIPICNVYFSGSTIGTMTDADGKFTISDLRPGTYDLIVSHVSYEFKSYPIVIDEKDIDLGRILLKEKPVETSYAEVKDKVDRKWRRQFTRFKNFIFGKHYREKDIEVPNAYVAEFMELNGTLVKKERFALDIRNNYTGYEIFYPIEEFLLGQGAEQFMVGFPRFTPLESNDSNQKDKWVQNRKKSYEGSLRHLFKSLLDRKLEENLFVCQVTNDDPQTGEDEDPGEYRYYKPVNATDIPGYLEIEDTKDVRVKKIVIKDYLEVNYINEADSRGQNQLTYIKANEGFVYVYTNGLLVDPQSVTAYGYLATEGLYEMLPFDYEPDGSVEVMPAAKPSTDEYRFESITPTIEEHISEYPQEKVYLHLAKPYYAKGETIWFKAYTLAGPNHIPSPLSQNLFVKLADSQNKIIAQKTLFLNQGLAHGEFQIPDSIAPGSYRISAYTNWMRNFDDGFFFNQTFDVIDPISSTSNVVRDLPKSQMRFFPEGGDLVNGLSSKVAFEISPQEPDTKGKIFDNNNTEVAIININSEGLGSFELTPGKGKSYYVKIDGVDGQFDVPQAKDEGYVLSVSDETDEQLIVLNIKALSDDDAVNRGYMIAHTRGLVGFSSEIFWKGAVGRIEIPKYNLASGIVHLTLFNLDGKPEAERLIFNQPAEAPLNVQITSDKEHYVLRDSAQFDIQVTDLEGKPVKAFLSLSAFDTLQINPSSFRENIESNLLISSDISGGIAESLKHFNSNDSTEKEMLDLVLMTKGWRRFLWKDIQTNTVPVIDFKEDRGLTVVGRALSQNGKKLIANAKVLHIGTFEGQPTLAQATTSENGSFRFEGLKYFEAASFLQVESEKGRTNLYIELDSVLGLAKHIEQMVSTRPNLFSRNWKVQNEESEASGFVKRSQERLSIDSAYNFDKITDLGTVVVQGTRLEQPKANIQRGLVFGRGEHSVNISDIMSTGQKFQNALYALQGRIPGFTITLSPINSEPIVTLSRKNESFRDPNPPTIYFVDDVEVDLSVFTSIPIESVQRVEVLKGMKAFQVFGSRANGGAIALYRKTDAEYRELQQKLADRLKPDEINTLLLEDGYAIGREFYAPDYTLKLPEHIRPDYRDLIHWEPMIETDESGKATIKFFNADLPTTVQINLEGISVDGTPVVKSKTYSVKRK